MQTPVKDAAQAQSPPSSQPTATEGGSPSGVNGSTTLSTGRSLDKAHGTEADMEGLDTQHDRDGGGGATTQTPSKSPRKIRGRRSDNAKNLRQPPAKPPVSPQAKPALICRENISEWQWGIVLQVPQEHPVSEVRQNDSVLSSDDCEYSLPNFSGSLSLQYTDDQEDLPLFDGRPLIFQLGKNWHGDGRKKRHIGRGYFLVFTPRQWTRLGNAPSERKRNVRIRILCLTSFLGMWIVQEM